MELIHMLEMMNGSNVDITVKHEKYGIIAVISTEKFSCHMDEFNIVLSNDTKDCNFDLLVPMSKIIDIDTDDFEDLDSISFELAGGLQYCISKI